MFRPPAGADAPKASSGVRARTRASNDLDSMQAAGDSPEEAPNPESARSESNDRGAGRQRTAPVARYEPQPVEPPDPGRQRVEPLTAPRVEVPSATLELAMIQSTVRLRYQTTGEVQTRPPGQVVVPMIPAPSIEAPTAGGVSIGQLAQGLRLRFWSQQTPTSAPTKPALEAEETAPEFQLSSGAAPSLGWLQTGPRLRYQGPSTDPVKPGRVALQGAGGDTAAPGIANSPSEGPLSPLALAALGGKGGPPSLPLDPSLGGSTQTSATAGGPGASAGGSRDRGASGLGEGTGPRSVGKGSGDSAVSGAGALTNAGRGSGPSLASTGSVGPSVPAPFAQAIQETTARKVVASLVRPEWEYSRSSPEETTSSRALDRSWLFHSRRTFEPAPISGLAVTSPVELLLQANAQPVRIDIEGAGTSRTSWTIWVLGGPESGSNGTEQSASFKAPSPVRTLGPEIDRSSSRKSAPKSLLLAAVIRQTGKIEDFNVIRGFRSDVEEKIILALRQWSFEPATRGGKPVDVNVMIAVPF